MSMIPSGPPSWSLTVTNRPNVTSTVPLTNTLEATNTLNGTATPTATLTSVQLALSKTAFLLRDADRNNRVSPGDQLRYVITLSNLGNRPAQQLYLVDTPDPNTTLVVGTVKTDQGQVIQGNSLGNGRVLLALDTLAPGGRATLSFQVGIQPQAEATQIQNQAVATFERVDANPTGQMVVLSDDPATTAAFDATVTVLYGNPPQPSRQVFLPFIACQN
jgi:uncharacterized repeat protein (TIGR01451 family)